MPSYLGLSRADIFRKPLEGAQTQIPFQVEAETLKVNSLRSGVIDTSHRQIGCQGVQSSFDSSTWQPSTTDAIRRLQKQELG
jgi:hypothetical protein